MSTITSTPISLALQAHRVPGVHATMLRGETRQVFAGTYGEPPDPLVTAAVVGILEDLAGVIRGPGVRHTAAHQAARSVRAGRKTLSSARRCWTSARKECQP